MGDTLGCLQRLRELHLRALLHVQLLHEGRLLHGHLHLAQVRHRPSCRVLKKQGRMHRS
jgi:hypothetical protein